MAKRRQSNAQVADHETGQAALLYQLESLGICKGAKMQNPDPIRGLYPTAALGACLAKAAWRELHQSHTRLTYFRIYVEFFQRIAGENMLESAVAGLLTDHYPHL